ncbi:cadherin repeat domain-containing protein, partial [bacterium]|nr:cadherin repeat domain-containing protein [bacterium]
MQKLHPFSVEEPLIKPAPVPDTHDTPRGGIRVLGGRPALLLTLLLVFIGGLGLAAEPVLEPNQLLWVPALATNGTVVGALGLTTTNNVEAPLGFRIVSSVPNDAFTIETTNYVGLIKLANTNLLAMPNPSHLFSLGVSVTNASGGSTASVLVLAPPAFEVSELSSNGISVGAIASGLDAAQLRFGVDDGRTADPQILQAFSLDPNGEITVRNGLAIDAESVETYLLGVVATNLATGRLASGQVLIRVADVNEPPALIDQAFTLPEDISEDFIGPLHAEDPEQDLLTFEILQVEAGGGVIPNDYFQVLNHTNLHLKSVPSYPPASSILTVLVTELRTDGQPALTNLATVTVEAPKSYSRFGIPLLVPVPGHSGGTTNGLPIQAMATGTNQDVYVSGMDSRKQPYLQIWPKGFYGDPKPSIPLETNFIPVAIAVSGTNLYLAGQKTDTNTAALYLFSTDGVPLRTNYLVSGSYTYFNVMDLLEDSGKLYLCGGTVSGGGWMVPYWAELDGTNLAFTAGSPHLWTSRTDMGGAPAVAEVTWGVATAIAKRPGLNEVYVAGYDTFWRRWYVCDLNMGFLGCWASHYEYRWGGISGFISHYSNGNLQGGQTLRSWSEGGQGTFVKDMVFASSSDGSDYLYALEEYVHPDLPFQQASTLRPDGSYSQDVVVKRLSSDLQTSSIKNFRLYGQGDVKAEALTIVKDGNTNSLVVSGVLPGGKATMLNSDQVVRSPGRDSYFLLQLDLQGNELTMRSTWPVVLNQ